MSASGVIDAALLRASVSEVLAGLVRRGADFATAGTLRRSLVPLVEQDRGRWDVSAIASLVRRGPESIERPTWIRSSKV